MARRFRRKKATGAACEHCGRAKGARKVPRCPRCPGQPIAASLSLEPLLGVRIVGIDPGATSAVSVTSPTVPNRLEVCRELDPLSPDVDDVLDAAVQRSEDDGAPLWVVIEEPGMGGERATPSMLVGMGQRIGMWRRAAVLAGVPDSRIILLRQITWQAGALPQEQTGGDREDRIAQSLRVARAVWGSVTTKGAGIEWTDDKAASALISWFVARWPTFLDQVGVRDRERAARVAENVAKAPVRPYVEAVAVAAGGGLLG